MSLTVNSPPNKPAALPPNFESIPAELRVLNQFGVWSYEEITDEESGECWVDKIPRNARTGRRASSTNPGSWSSFDLDKCRSRTTGAIEQWAQSIVDRLGSYCELSPSGRGLRLFVWGELPPRD